MNGWTEERRARQREAIKRWKPWEKSTGPRTKEGKNRAAMNGWKTGHHCREMREIRHLLRLQRNFMRRVEDHWRMQKALLRAKEVERQTIHMFYTVIPAACAARLKCGDPVSVLLRRTRIVPDSRSTFALLTCRE